MNVIWKRPDGFHGASPKDFVVFTLNANANIWFHKKDRDTFPFRISGGWEEEQASKRLNNLINLLRDSPQASQKFLKKSYDNSMFEDPEKFVVDLQSWLDQLKKHVKGDTWERDIMEQTFSILKERLESSKRKFATIQRSK